MCIFSSLHRQSGGNQRHEKWVTADVLCVKEQTWFSRWGQAFISFDVLVNRGTLTRNPFALSQGFSPSHLQEQDSLSTCTSCSRNWPFPDTICPSLTVNSGRFVFIKSYFARQISDLEKLSR